MELPVLRPASLARTAERAPKIQPLTPAVQVPLDDQIDPNQRLVKQAWDMLERYGAKSLFTFENPKVLKSKKLKYLTAILHLAPADISGYEVCPRRSEGCTRACLNTAGNPVWFKNKQRARIARTRFMFEQPHLFNALLVQQIKLHVRRARKVRMRPCVRLNGTSDIVWERRFPALFARYRRVQFYEYSKIGRRFMPDWKMPPNYHLCFSRSETNEAEAVEVLKAGGRVAVVFGGCGDSVHPKPLPATWRGFPVVDGDKHDLIFLQPSACVVGLRAKGQARKDVSGFAVWVNPSNQKI
jgi:hypothetical protein